MFLRDEVQNYAKDNFSKILDQMDSVARGRVLGGIAEIMAAEMTGGTFVDADGYDYDHPVFGKVEVKSTSDIQTGGTLRIQSLLSKKDKCDHIHIIDMNSGRSFMISHDVFFNEMDLIENGNVLRWSASYNETDNIRKLNTKIMLENEYPG
jgi:hypothetical protein|tara:strand:+ start:117 stop:569 length:453 start_codon:yes stop_codon:yes gene_type:complete